MEDFEHPSSPKIKTSDGGLCLVDWCVETTAVSPEDTVSFFWLVWLLNQAVGFPPHPPQRKFSRVSIKYSLP